MTHINKMFFFCFTVYQIQTFKITMSLSRKTLSLFLFFPFITTLSHFEFSLDISSDSIILLSLGMMARDELIRTETIYDFHFHIF